MRQVRLAVFPGAFNWPVWVARERGFFMRAGLDVIVTDIPGSVAQWTMMAEGTADLAITLMDNVIAYREGQGEAPVTVPDALAVMTSDARTMPALMVQPDIASYDDLRGKLLAVDAMSTGLALILFALLENGGLRPGEYDILRSGGVLQRFNGMAERRFAGSLFNAPFSSQLAADGFHRLDTTSKVVPRYQGHVVSVRAAWAEQNRDIVTGFIRALSEAIDWLYEPANRDDAFGIFARGMPDAAPGAAEVAYTVLFDAEMGFVRLGEIDHEGVAAVLSLRERFGVPPKPLQAPGAYYDLTYRDAALAS